MKKLRLELDQLSVESFHIPSTETSPGTVRANAEMAAGTTDIVSFLLFGTCDYSCNETCKATCNATCANSCANTLCNNTLCQAQTTTYVHKIDDGTIVVDY
jgi:hypothetical protein